MKYCLTSTFTVLLSLGMTCSLQAQNQNELDGTAKKQTFKEIYAKERPRLLAELSSSDERRVSTAIGEIREWGIHCIGQDRAAVATILVDAKKYKDANTISLELILQGPGNLWAIESLQRLRAKSLLAAGDPKGALSAAKSYYNVCRLKQTPDAISLICLCLLKDNPKDASIAEKFKKQQVATSTATAKDDPALGPKIIDTIQLEEQQISDAADGLEANTYRQMMTKGNLLLMAGRNDEAKQYFDQAYTVVTQKYEPEAIEGVARAIRAQSGCLGPANLYLTELQK